MSATRLSLKLWFDSFPRPSTAVSALRGDVPIYDIEFYKGRLYAAATDLLMVREGNSWSVVRHGLKGADFLRLTIGDGRLWAMGT